MQDAVLGVSTLSMKLKAAIGGLVEACTPGDQILNQLRRTAHDQFHSLAIALTGTADQRILDMFLEGIGLIGHRTDATLGIICVTLGHLAFGDDRNRTALSGFEGKRQACRARTNYQKIGFHWVFSF